MISKSFRVALSALLFAGALGLASTGAAQAQSIMKQCGDDWKAAKANNTTNGMKWPEFLKQCRAQKEGAAAPRRCCSRPRARSARPGARRQPISRSRSPCRPLARRALANSLQRRKRRRDAPATRWFGSTPRASPTPITIRAHAGSERPSRAPTCARLMLALRATMRRRAGRSSRNSSPEPGKAPREPCGMGEARAARVPFNHGRSTARPSQR